MIHDLESLRLELRAERIRCRYSQRYIADMMGMTVKWLSQFENGHTDPPASCVIRLARMQGFTFEPQKVLQSRR